VAPGVVRTCVGCRARAPKATLVRIVATSGVACVDRSCTAPGRGAYVHPDPACLAAAGADDVLGRALRSGLAVEEVGRLMLEIERMGAQ
jgi:uncharacterized protein